MSSTPNVYTCDAVTPTYLLQYSIYGYFPSLPANAFFLSFFVVLVVAQVYLGIRYRTWTFAFALCCGCLVEAFGYIGRLMLHHNPFSNNGFTMQICCLIMGPAWLAMSVYLTLKHVVKALGPQYSYLKPKMEYEVERSLLLSVYSVFNQALGLAGSCISTTTIRFLYFSE